VLTKILRCQGRTYWCMGAILAITERASGLQKSDSAITKGFLLEELARFILAVKNGRERKTKTIDVVVTV